jgi:hypothetical protein
VTEVKCHWSGSEAGIADLAGSGTEQFLADGAVSDTNSTPPGPFTSSQVDIAMADNNKAFSKNPNATITGAFVGVIPFKWVAEKGSNTNIANVTDAQIRVLLSGGNPVPLLSGIATDKTNWVYITGRNSNSGTRVNCYGICRYGIFTAPFQLQVNPNGSMVDQGGGTFLGDFGYESGGDVAKQMGYDLSVPTSQDLNTGTSNRFSVVAYLGVSDAGSAVSNGGKELSYNGLFETTANVREGQYGYWGDEWIYRKNTVSSAALSVFNKLSPVATGINHHADNVALIDQTTMNATRNGPTDDPVHNP